MPTFFAIAAWIMVFWLGIAMIAAGLFTLIVTDRLNNHIISIESLLLFLVGAGLLYATLSDIPLSISLGVVG